MSKESTAVRRCEPRIEPRPIQPLTEWRTFRAERDDVPDPNDRDPNFALVIRRTVDASLLVTNSEPFRAFN